MAQETAVTSDGVMVVITLSDSEADPPYETIIALPVQDTEGLSDSELDRLVNQKVDQKNKELSQTEANRISAEVARVNAILS